MSRSYCWVRRGTTLLLCLWAASSPARWAIAQVPGLTHFPAQRGPWSCVTVTTHLREEDGYVGVHVRTYRSMNFKIEFWSFRWKKISLWRNSEPGPGQTVCGVWKWKCSFRDFSWKGIMTWDLCSRVWEWWMPFRRTRLTFRHCQEREVCVCPSLCTRVSWR